MDKSPFVMCFTNIQQAKVDMVTYMSYFMTMEYEGKEKANVGMVKEHFSAYVTKAEQGESTIVCRRNRPVAEIVPVKQVPESNRTRLGSARGSVVVKCDLCAPVIDEGDWDMLS